MDRKNVIAELKRVAAILGTACVSRGAFQLHAGISSGAVEKTFGSWNEAIVEAGLIPLPQGGQKGLERKDLEAKNASGRVQDGELLDALLELAQRLGRRPSGNQVSAKGKYEATVYQRRWGSISAAYEAALARSSATGGSKLEP